MPPIPYSSVYLPYTSELAMLTAYPCKGLPATLRLVTVTLTLPAFVRENFWQVSTLCELDRVDLGDGL